MNKIHKAEMLTRMIRRSGISKKAIADMLGVSVPTLRKYIVCPETMNGIRRKQLAKIMCVQVEAIDYIVNSAQKIELEKAQQIIELVKPKTQHNENIEH